MSVMRGFHGARFEVIAVTAGGHVQEAYLWGGKGDGIAVCRHEEVTAVARWDDSRQQYLVAMGRHAGMIAHGTIAVDSFADACALAVRWATSPKAS